MPYVTIDQALTDSAAFRSLSWNAGNLLLRLICYPTVKSFGMLRASPGGLEDDFDGALERDVVVECLDELQEAGFLRWERGAIALSMELVSPPGLNLVKSWARHLEEMRPGSVLDERCRELALRIHARAEREDDPAKARQWLDALPELVARHLDVVDAEPANDDEPKASDNPSRKASEKASRMPSRKASRKASEMPLRELLAQDSGLRSQNSQPEAADARVREGAPEVPPEVPEQLARVVGVALGRDPTTQDLDELASLLKSWGVERVTETAERVLARSVAENKPPSSVGLVRRCLTDGDPLEAKTLDDPNGYAAHLRFSLEHRWFYRDHPLRQRLLELVPLLTTEAGLNGIAQGLGRNAVKLVPVRWDGAGWVESRPRDTEGYLLDDGRVVDREGNEITHDDQEAVA